MSGITACQRNMAAETLAKRLAWEPRKNKMFRLLFPRGSLGTVHKQNAQHFVLIAYAIRK
jgi:hypothetical protein